MTDIQRMLPDGLLSIDGRAVTTAEEWMAYRRDELLNLFREHVYGREPELQAGRLFFEAEPGTIAMNGQGWRRKVKVIIQGEGGGGQCVIHVLLFVPHCAESHPVPALLLINNRGSDIMDPERKVKTSFWPAEYIISRGYAAVVFATEDVDPDFDDGFHNGVHGLLDSSQRPRPADAWGTIAAWAWGASRVMDYLETDPWIDSKRVAVIGHSRGGKTALWAGALDTRFAMVVANNSGSTGAALARGKTGETIRDINTKFPHWFSENYKQYNDRENELPVDQHLLLSLIAPRVAYVSSATEDSWADPASEFKSAVLAGGIYALFGLAGLAADKLPEPDCPIYGEAIAYHLRTGYHNMTEYDWECFIDMADRSI